MGCLADSLPPPLRLRHPTIPGAPSLSSSSATPLAFNTQTQAAQLMELLLASCHHPESELQDRCPHFPLVAWSPTFRRMEPDSDKCATVLPWYARPKNRQGSVVIWAKEVLLIAGLGVSKHQHVLNSTLQQPALPDPCLMAYRSAMPSMWPLPLHSHR